MSGGPEEGAYRTPPGMEDAPRMIVFGHVPGCSCEWCGRVKSESVMHVYELNDDDVYVYKRSHPADAP